MKVIFWIIIVIVYFLLAIISLVTNIKIDKRYVTSKEDFKKDYGFKPYDFFEFIQQYTQLSTYVNFIGFILAGLVALVSMY